MTVTGTAVLGGATFVDNATAYFGTDLDLRILHTGSEGQINNTVGNLLLDVAGDIILDADDGDIILKDGGTTFGQFSISSGDLFIQQPTADKDIVFRGLDGSSYISALTLDMSEGGRANFNNDIGLSDNRALRLGSDDDAVIYNDGSNTWIRNSTSNHDIIIQGNDDGSTGTTALTFDMSEGGRAVFGAGGGKLPGLWEVDGYFTANATHGIRFNNNANSANRMILTDAGVLSLLHDTTPYFDLKVYGTMKARLYADANQTILESAANTLILKSASVQALKFDNYQNAVIKNPPLNAGSAFTSYPLQLFSSQTLGGTAGNLDKIVNFAGADSTNVEGLGLYHYRRVDGTNWTTAGFSLRLEVDNSSSVYNYMNFAQGRVAIGNNPDPLYQLDVEGTGNFNDTLYFAEGVKGYISWGSMAGGTGFGMLAASNTALSFGSGSVWDRMAIAYSGETYYPEAGNPVSASDGSFTQYIGSISQKGTADRYLHVALNTTDNTMFSIYWEGYGYRDATFGRGSFCGYHYGASGIGSQNIKTDSVSDMASHSEYMKGGNASNANVVIVIDTEDTVTSNRWGGFHFRGGMDTITTNYAFSIVEYAWSSSTSDPF